MKKYLLLITLIMISTPVFAQQYTLKSNYYRPVSQNVMNKTDAEILRAFLAGTSFATGRLNLISTPSIARATGLSYLDPYVVTVQSKNYILIKDSVDGKWTVDNILGSNDSKEDLFASLKSLEADGDTSKITVEEMKNAGIRFAQLNADGSVALNERNLDYDLKNVLYIDMKNLRTALGNKNEDGTFGYFYVIIQDGDKKRPVAGRVTFEEKNELNKYLQ